MILEYMRDDHRACDHFYTEAENALAAKNIEEAKRLFDAFYTATMMHFEMEEEELFPTFEAHSGMSGGPMQVMRFEHQQLRGLLESMRHALADNNPDDFFGLGESMMIMLQQHNMKEEQMLYPMMDRTLGDDSAATIVEALKEMRA